MPSPFIQAIAFDLDNTLIDRDAAFLRLIKDWLSSVNTNKRTLIEDILIHDAHGHSDRTAFFRHLARMRIFQGNGPGLRNRFIQQFPAYFQSDSAVHELLQRLSDRSLKLAVLTNGSSEMQRAKLNHAGLTKFFEPGDILISGEIGHDKPAPEAFKMLSDRLDTAPENTLFVGDHPEYDISGAAALGFQTCWLPVSSVLDELTAPPFDFKISSLLELESTCLT